ncbi:MAG: transporter substrate-binding domain-containing protein [Alphaproteobacteria bacterium]|nr:transporter substrate-binding domain-containing protein [Alphaproteobacteria bacterium]
MNRDWTRRRVVALGGTALLAPTLVTSRAGAQGEGLLARLQASKKVRVGLANQPPFSALNPDGTLTGVAPTISQMVLTRLGITEVEGLIGTYGELVPGMMAGRWDFIASCLTVTQPRCEQVQYSDPITSDGRCIVTLKGEKGPRKISELKDYVVGLLGGGADFRLVQTRGVPLTSLRQFPNDTALLDGLLAKRFQAEFGSHPGIADMIRKRGLETELDVVFPIQDDAISFAACAFRKDDTDFFAAFQRELRALKASGEFAKVVSGFGFDVSDNLLTATPEKACTF